MLKNAEAIIARFSPGEQVIYRYLQFNPCGTYIAPCPDDEHRVLVEFDGVRKSVHCTAIQHRAFA